MRDVLVVAVIGAVVGAITGGLIQIFVSLVDNEHDHTSDSADHRSDDSRYFQA